MNSNKRLLSEVRIIAPIDAIWSAMTVPEQIQQWFGWQYDGLEAEIDEIFVAGATSDASTHTLRWEHGDEMTLRSDGNATVMQTFRPTTDVDPMSEQSEDIDEGWIAFTEQLRFWLERHPSEQRSTIYLSGPARTPHASLAEALGLNVGGAVGQQYETDAITGERLSGTVWSRLGTVTSLTVDDYGNGLIVLIDHDAQRHAPNGGGMVTITTYGLSSERLEQLRTEWATAWDAKYEASSEFGAESPS